jgi:DNA-binding NarL/FixJ family response regulator
VGGPDSSGKATDAPILVMSTGGIEPLRVAVFDDVVAARGEVFHIPGLAVDVYAHADDAVALCLARPHDVVFMDFAMGPGRRDGATAIAALRQAGFVGRVVAISSDPAANDAMKFAGAGEALAKKAHLRSFLVHIGAQHLAAARARPS